MSGRRFARVGRAPQGSTPFVIHPGGGITFDGRSGREIEFGHSFDRQRGYRVFFCFKDTPQFKNTWGGESLAEYAEKIEPKDEAARQLQMRCRQLARQVISLNTEWTRQGRPAEGIAEGAPGHG